MTSPGTTKTPVYLMRFCLLFPHADKRVGESEDDFLPGQGIELQTRGSNKETFSRYFLPIRGNSVCFEILVKCSANGAMGALLAASRIGTKQFKIRYCRKFHGICGCITDIKSKEGLSDLHLFLEIH